MKRMLLTISIPILVAALLVVFSGLVAARVSGRCDNCHTMHNSQGGSPMNLDGSETLNKVLLIPPLPLFWVDVLCLS